MSVLPAKHLLRLEIKEFIPASYSRVLEIGCAEGFFALNLSKNCEYWGIEPSEKAAETAAKKLNRVLAGKYEEVYAQLPDNYFDLVICNDVIEHMVDTDNFFQSIKRKMSKEAYLIGSIPNVLYFSNLYRLIVKKEWEYEDYGILDRTHLRFFTGKSLRNTIIRNGYIIEKFHGVSSAIVRPKKIKWFVSDVLICLVCLFSFGYFADIRFKQFGFRIRPNGFKPN